MNLLCERSVSLLYLRLHVRKWLYFIYHFSSNRYFVSKVETPARAWANYFYFNIEWTSTSGSFSTSSRLEMSYFPCKAQQRGINMKCALQMELLIMFNRRWMCRTTDNSISSPRKTFHFWKTNHAHLTSPTTHSSKGVHSGGQIRLNELVVFRCGSL